MSNISNSSGRRKLTFLTFRRRSGFSVTELLVVISIIAILSVMGYSGYRKAKDLYYRTACQSNLKQIHSGLVAYSMENENRLPVAFGAPYTAQDTTWSYLTWPYIYGGYKNWKYPDNCVQMGTPVYAQCMANVFRCLATKEKAVPAPTTGGATYNARFSYGLNDTPARTKNYLVNGVYILTWNLAVSPSSTALVTESSSPMGNNQRYLYQYGLVPHNGQSNVLYFDGHVESLAFTSMPTDESDPFWSGSR